MDRRYRNPFVGTKVYKSWGAMIQRCENKRNPHYAYYGGCGISVCEEWHHAETFCRWAMANGYAVDLTLDRVNPHGDYNPANCRWATRFVQARNTRRLRVDNTSGYRGVSHHAKRRNRQWSSSIQVGRAVHLGFFHTALEAAHEYDAFVIGEGLEHTTNFSRTAL